MPGALDVLKPFAWLAAIAFLVGFCSYLVLGHPSPAIAQEGAYAAPSAVSGPASDDWNLPKRI
jgi:hypothetical protein